MNATVAESLLFHFFWPHRNERDRFKRSATRTEIHRLVQLLRAVRNRGTQWKN